MMEPKLSTGEPGPAPPGPLLHVTPRSPHRVSCSSPYAARRSEPRGHVDQMSQGTSLHFSHHLAPVRFHGDLADAELAGNLLVQTSGDNQRHDFAFATAKRRVPLSERPYLG